MAKQKLQGDSKESPNIKEVALGADKKQKYVMKVDAVDTDNSAITYKKGDDVSHFDEHRLQRGINNGIIELK